MSTPYSPGNPASNDDENIVYDPTDPFWQDGEDNEDDDDIGGSGEEDGEDDYHGVLFF